MPRDVIEHTYKFLGKEPPRTALPSLKIEQVGRGEEAAAAEKSAVNPRGFHRLISRVA